MTDGPLGGRSAGVGEPMMEGWGGGTPEGVRVPWVRSSHHPQASSTLLHDLPGPLLAAAPGPRGAGVRWARRVEDPGGPEWAAHRGGAQRECCPWRARGGGVWPSGLPPADSPLPSGQNATLVAEKVVLQGQLQHLEGQLGSLQGRAQELLLQSQRAQEYSSRLQVGSGLGTLSPALAHAPFPLPPTVFSALAPSLPRLLFPCA